MSSPTRCHGAPPREPWEYDEEFPADFRRTIELRYRLLPYLLREAKESSAHGWPMLRTLFFEFPDDPTSWLVEDQYLLGSNLLVRSGATIPRAPLAQSIDQVDWNGVLERGYWADRGRNSE